MIKKKKMKVVLAAFAGVMLFGGLAFSPNKSQAAKKVSITKSVKVYEGKTAKIKLSNNKKKVTWSVIKGNSLLSLTNESKKGVTVIAYDAGTAKVRAKIGRKKYVCTVTIKVAPDADAKNGILTSSNLRYWGVKDSGAVVIPEGVKIIDSYVFGEDVTSIKLPKTLETIRSDAFCSCKITSIKLPESLKTIEEYAFANSSLESIEIPDTVKELGDKLFYGCLKLKSVKLPTGLEKIGKSMFENCEVLTDVTIPDGVTSISEYCFSNCYALKNIKLPDSLKELRDSAFYGCKNLADITIPKGVTTIDEFCFWGCDRLKNITIPDSVTYISSTSFELEVKVTWKGTTYEDSYDFIYAFSGEL